MKKRIESQAFLCFIGPQRSKFGYSQEQLAHDVGVTRRTIHLLETQQTRPSLELAMRIAQVLESTVEELFVFTTEKDAKRRMRELTFMNTW